MLSKAIGIFGGLAILAAGCGKVQGTVPAESGGVGVTGGQAAEAPPRGRLPAHTRPVMYRLTLDIVPDTDAFSGHAEIDVVLTEPREVLWLHAQDMDATAVVRPANGGASISAQFSQVSDDGTAAIRLPQALSAGKYTVVLDYTAKFDRNLRGLYRVDSAGESYAFTQFEPTAARKAFPSFDEPAFKTPFDVTLRVKQDHTAISSGREMESRLLDSGLKEVRFATTEAIPTYLMAFAVGPLDVVEAPDIAVNTARARALPFRGVAAKGRGPELKYALTHTPAMVAHLEEYFGIAYPYDKLDIIAVPDFAAGAMENVGAITFRDSLLLVKADGPQRMLQYFAGIMAHELAHQWFGNLVTMPWWDDIWLNEAFATWMGHRVVQDLYPEYEADLSLLGRIHGAMNVDARVSARQIRQPIESNHDIENAFDVITYRKGGGVLAMFERYVTKDAFRAALREYMQRYRFGSATAEDLVKAIARQTERPVTGPFFSFLNQPGVPLVEAELACSQQGVSLSLQQSRYFPAGSAGERDQTWGIPVCVRYGIGDRAFEECVLLDKPSQTLPLSASECPDWLMPNAGAAGYYRWSLPEADLTKLRNAGWQHMSVPERMSTAASLFSAMKAGSLPVDAVLTALAPTVSDGQRHVLASTLEVFSFTKNQLLEPEDWPRYQSALGKFVTPRVADLGFAPQKGAHEGPSKRMLRQLVVSTAALDIEDRATRRRMAKMGMAYLLLQKGTPPDPNLLPVALNVAVQESGKVAVDAIVQRLFKSEDGLERAYFLDALGSSLDEGLAEQARALALDERIRGNEVNRVLWVQMSDPRTREAAWEWLKANYEAVVARLSSRRAGQLPQLAQGFCSEAAAVDVEAFFAPKIESVAGGPRELLGVLEAIRLCAVQRDAQSSTAKRFFAN